MKSTRRADLKLRCAALGAGCVLLFSASPALASGTLSIESASVDEGSAGQVDAVFTVTTTPDSFPTTVDYTTEDGSAVAGSDYVAANGTLTIPADEAQGSIVVKVNGDTEVEPDESFSIRLSNADSESSIAIDTAEGIIVNDDKAIAKVKKGTKGNDNQKGTAEPDVQLGGGGKDKQKGAAGDDVQAPDGPGGPICIQLRGARADANAEIDALVAAFARAAPGELSAALAQLESFRAETNKKFDLILAGLRCRAAKAALVPSAWNTKSQSVDDTLKGGSGDDLQLGGGGNDRIEGGPGRDVVIAGRGADKIDVKGGESDIVDCGPGKDVVRSDSTDVLRKNCE